MTLDIETTGLDKSKDRIIELGMVMYDLGKKTIVRMLSCLVMPQGDIPMDHWEASEKIHGISWITLQQYGMPERAAFQYLLSWCNLADYIAGHNVLLFDKPFLEAWATSRGEKLPKKLWIDTLSDLPVQGTRLVWMMAEHAGIINPFPHRAVFDALGVLQLITHFGAETVIERAKLPSITIQAEISYDDRQKAKERGFHWQAETRRWLKTIKEPDLAKEQMDAGFLIAVVK
jgi:DNA polymerase-3 subunit epsilon